MKKFVCENLEELRENYLDEPEEGDKVPSEVRDAMYQAGKEGFEPQGEQEGFEQYDHEFGIEEELLDYFSALIKETTMYTDLDRATIEKIFKKAMDIHYQEG